MNKKQIKQTMFALCTAALFTTGCSNDVLTSTGNDGSKEEGTSVLFNLSLPQGDEVNYTRATSVQDQSEWILKKLKVYHFSGTSASGESGNPTDAEYKLEAILDVPVKDGSNFENGTCISKGDGTYSMQLSLRSDAATGGKKHAFAFVANDSCATFNSAAVAGTTTLADLKTQVGDKQVTGATASASSLFMGDPAGLCMTGIVTNQELKSGINTLSTPIPLKRIMARLDVKNYVPESRNFQLKSIRILYSDYNTAPKGYLFDTDTKANIWTLQEKMEITQNGKYDEIGYLPYDKYATTDAAWVDQTVSTDGNKLTGTWYKKVLYMYEFPAKINSTKTKAPQVEITYTLNGSISTAIVDMVKLDAGNNPQNFDIKRNVVYTLQVGETNTSGESLIFGFTATQWTGHEIDVDLNGGEADTTEDI